MRILHLTPYYKPAYAFGGVVRSVEGMATSLSQRGHEVTVLTTDALDRHGTCHKRPDEMIDGLRVLRRPNALPWLRGRLNLSTPRSLKRTAEAILPAVDLLHIHEFRTLENLLVTPSAQRFGVPIVLSPHGTLNPHTGRGAMKSAWDRLFSPSIALRIEHVIALTAAEREEAEALWEGFGRRQIPTDFSVIPNGVHPPTLDPLLAEAFRARFKLGLAPTILFMGRLQARKGVDALIQAFKAADLGDMRLLIVGPDEDMLPALRALAGGDRRIIFTGYLEGDARLGALAASDIFALPATGEGQPIAALEAMAARLPVILSPGCNMGEVAQAGAGFVVEPTVEAVAEKLTLLLTDRALRQEMGKRARRLVDARYTWAGIAPLIEDVYRASLRSGR